MAVDLSIVIPVLNDAVALENLLGQLRPLCEDAVELIVVDGGSSDGSAGIARASAARVLAAPANRGAQLNAGCRVARGDWIWMLHADSLIPQGSVRCIRALTEPGWGRFNIAFEPQGPGMRLIATLMNLRAALSGICTGDQGVFVHRRLLAAVGGVPEQPLMEDIELCRRLKTLCRPRCLSLHLVTSSRRWSRHGAIQTVLGMWWLRLRYWWGADPADLAAEYYG